MPVWAGACWTHIRAAGADARSVRRSPSGSPRPERGRRRSRSRSRSSERLRDITEMSYDEYLAAFSRVRARR
jgi:hypothetical protein